MNVKVCVYVCVSVFQFPQKKESKVLMGLLIIVNNIYKEEKLVRKLLR